MKFVIQRVKKASVEIGGEIFSSINQGLLVLFCAEKGDFEKDLEYFVNKILKLRIFEDENGKMSLSVLDIGGEILAVSQFTLAACCKKGARPSFDAAMEPNSAKIMYEKFIEILQKTGEKILQEKFYEKNPHNKIFTNSFTVKTGVFGADMQVGLVNDGPVTIIL